MILKDLLYALKILWSSSSVHDPNYFILVTLWIILKTGHVPKCRITFKDQELEVVYQFKYLGIMIEKMEAWLMEEILKKVMIDLCPSVKVAKGLHTDCDNCDVWYSEKWMWNREQRSQLIVEEEKYIWSNNKR